MVHLDEAVHTHIRRELEGRPGAWFVLHTRIVDGAWTEITHLETLAKSVEASRKIGYFPAGPLYWAANPSEVSQEVDHSRLGFVMKNADRHVQAYMTFLRSGEDIRTATIFRHDTKELGPHDLLLADAEALIVDVVGLAAGFGEVTGFEGEIRFRLDVAVPEGEWVRLRAQDEADGTLRPCVDCPGDFEPVEGGFPVPDHDGAWAKALYQAGKDLAERFGVAEPQLIPRPDVKPSFEEVLAHGVERSHL